MFQSIKRLHINSELITQTLENVREFDGMESASRDAEARLRDDTITGDQAYLTAMLTSLISTTVGLSLVAALFWTVLDSRRKVAAATAVLFVERERRQEQSLRWSLEQIQDYAIFTMDIDCKATSWNKGVRQVLGFDEHEFIGHDILPLIFTPEARAAGIPEIEFSLAALDQSASEDRWMMRKGGIEFRASGITTSIRDHDNRLIGYCKVMRDLTSARKSQDDLSELATQLAEMDRRQHEFLANLAHELRNPLAPIKNAVQLLGMLSINPEIDELRHMMASQVEKLVRLIDELLDVSRIGRSKISLPGEIVDLRANMDAPVEACSPLIAENRHPSTKSFKILIVEDMRALRVITARLLEKLGHVVEFAENGPLGLLKLDTFTPDVVFSDIAMPGMTGYELAQRIRQRPECSQVYLVALTAFGRSSDRDKALEAGFDDHMVKPVDIELLQSLFERIDTSGVRSSGPSNACRTTPMPPEPMTPDTS